LKMTMREIIEGEQDIPRAPIQIPENDFLVLFKLTKKHSWLEPLINPLLSLWNLCDTTDQRELICALISRFQYVDSLLLGNYAKEIANHIKSHWKLTGKDTTLIAVANSSDSDGSQFLLHAIKKNFADTDDWHEICFVTRMRDALEVLGQKKNLILVDDFIGTGDTVEKRVNYLKTKSQGKAINIFVCSCARMEFADIKLSNLGVKVFTPLSLKKGISNYHVGQELQNAIDCMNALEDKLEHHFRNNQMPRFGYQRSESLFYIDPYNVPNNVFPIFWWSALKGGKQRHTMFTRF
jgi:hypothetical protein